MWNVVDWESGVKWVKCGGVEESDEWGEEMGEWMEECGGKCRPLPLFNSIKNFTPFPPRSTTPSKEWKSQRKKFHSNHPTQHVQGINKEGVVTNVNLFG